MTEHNDHFQSLTPDERSEHDKRSKLLSNIGAIQTMDLDQIAAMPQWDAEHAQAFVFTNGYAKLTPDALSVLALTQEQSCMPQTLALACINQHLDEGKKVGPEVFDSREARIAALGHLRFDSEPERVQEREIGERLMDAGKGILRTMGVYQPSHDSIAKRAKWMAETVVLKALTEYKETGRWDDTLFIGDHSDSARRREYLTLDQAMKGPERAVSAIEMRIDLNEDGLAAQWEKSGKAPGQCVALDTFAKKIESITGDTSAPGVMDQQIDHVIHQIHAQKIAARISSGTLFQTLSSSKETARAAAPSPM